MEELNATLLKETQGNLSTANISRLKEEPEKLFFRGGKVVVPELLVVRFMVHSHIIGEHRSFEEERQFVQDNYECLGWKRKEIEDLVALVRHRCLHCDRFPKMVRRPQDVTKLGSKPGEVLMMDYLYVNQREYILVLAASLSRKVEVRYAERPDARSAVFLLLQWRASYGFVEHFMLITDRGSHFTSSLVSFFAHSLRFVQSFAISYAP